MRTRIQLGIMATLAIVLLIGGVWWFMRGHRTNISPAQPVSTVPGDVEFRLNHPVVKWMSGGKILWELAADHIDFTKDQMTCRVSGIKKMALIKDKKQELTVNADRLEQNTLTHDISIMGNVTVLGTDLLFHAPSLTWQDRLQTLLIPQKLSAQFGDVTLSADGGATFNVGLGTMRSDGPVVVGIRGNIIRTHGVLVEAGGKQLTLMGPVQADFLVDDVEQWAAGQNLPKIPSIPAVVKERYRQYCQRQGR